MPGCIIPVPDFISTAAEIAVTRGADMAPSTYLYITYSRPMIDARRAVTPIHGPWVGSGVQKFSPELSWVGQV